MTRLKAEQIIKDFKELMERGLLIATELAKLDGYPTHTLDIEDMGYDYEDEVITADWCAQASCGEYEDYNINFPIDTIFDDDYIDKLKQKRLDEQLKRIEKEKIRKELEKKKQQAREYEYFLELKEKYKNK